MAISSYRRKIKDPLQFFQIAEVNLGRCFMLDEFVHFLIKSKLNCKVKCNTNLYLLFLL